MTERIRRLRTAPAEDIAWLGLVPGVAVALLAFHSLAPRMANRLLSPPTPDRFPEWAGIFRPEPLEEARFLIAIALPLVLAIVIVAFGTSKPANRRWDPAVIAIQLAVLVFVAAALTKQTRDGWLIHNEFFPLILSVPNVVAGVVIGAALTALAWTRPEVSLPERARSAAAWLRDSSWIAVALAVVVTAVWLLPAVVTDSTLLGSGFIVPAHVPTQFSDYLAVVNGRTPLVDYVPDYSALIPLVVAPVLPLFDLSFLSFSLIECALTVAAMMAVFAALALVTGGRWKALALYIPFVAISLFPWQLEGLRRDFNGMYFANLPNRYLGPFVLIWLTARYLRRGSPPPWALFLVAGLCLVNNFEFGLPTVGALVIAVAASVDRSEPLRETIRALAIQAAAGLAGAFALVSAVTLIKAGELPDPSILTYYSRQFGHSGFGLLPMPKYGLHWAVYFTYAGALVLAAVRLARAEPDRALTGMLAFAGTFGLLTGQYYAGRSIPSSLILLFPIWGFAAALLTWVVFLAVRDARGRGSLQPRWLVPAFAVLCVFGVMVSAIGRFPPPWDQADRLSSPERSGYELTKAQNFIESETDPGEPVLVLATPLDFRVAERAGVRNVSPWIGGGGLISGDEVDRAASNLSDEGGTKLFEATNVDSVREYLPTIGFRRVVTDPRTKITLWVRQ